MHPADDDSALVLRIRAGELEAQGSWIYAWLQVGAERPVVYVGATGLHPATRAWLHLHHEDPNVGRVAAAYPGAPTEALDVVAVSVPDGVARQEAKRAAIAALSAQGSLSGRYVGDPPAAPETTASAAAEQAGARLVRRIAAHLA